MSVEHICFIIAYAWAAKVNLSLTDGFRVVRCRVAGLLSVALLLPGCGCLSESFHDRQVCGMALVTVASPVLVPALLIDSAIPPRQRVQIEGIEALARIGGERIGMHVSAVGVGDGGRLVYLDVRGAAVTGGIVACPPGTRQRPRGPVIEADVPPGPGAIAFAPFDDTTVERPSLREVTVSVPRTRDTHSVAIPVSEDPQVREARQVFALACGPEGRAVLVVAEAAETTGAEVFGVAFKRTGQ